MDSCELDEAHGLNANEAMAHHPLTAFETALIEAALALTARLDVRETCRAMLDVAQRMFSARSSWILLHDGDSNNLVTVEFRGVGAEAYADVRIPCDHGIVGLAFKRREAVFVPDPRQEDRWYDPERIQASGMQSVFTVPLIYEGSAVGVVGLDSPLFTADRPPTGDDIARLRAIAAIAAAGVRHARFLEAVEKDRARLQQLLEQRRELRDQVGHLREQVRRAHGIDGLIGQSAVFREVLSQVDVVASADSTVLLVGETGTGKEIVARALHDQGRRVSHPFVAVNCAALPETLVESELFGYEKGAFTGAVNRKAGKFELAHRGTLFLDEVGDLPPQAQAKLLRVLQEREVQRVGGLKAVPVDVRLVAATNQDLEARMEAGQFRPDLFYRLSVFPIRLPPLRERRDDIPLLAERFLCRFAEQQHKPTPRLTPRALDRIGAYDWPGNVRELQNVIERAVILARDPVIDDDLLVLRQSTDVVRAGQPEPPRKPGDSNVVRFSDAERLAILRAIERAGWRISGHGGAAEMLGLKPTTLHAKMKKLGIHRPSASVAS
jgi:formate hydrogenlyase transcriptional activator